MRLARAGHHVALVDRASFPSDTVSTHFLWQRAAARLEAWGVRSELEARGSQPIEEITFDVGTVQLRGTGPAVDGVTATYCPRRTRLDAVLVDAAVDAGAELIEDFVVDEVVWSGARAAGVRGHRRGAPARRTLGSTVVVGADGRHSTVAAAVGATAYHEHPALTAVYYSYWSGVEEVGASFHARTGQLVLTWPTDDELTCIFVAWPHGKSDQVRADVDTAFHDALRLVDGLEERVRSGRRVARYAGTRDLPNFYRTSAGPGWALVGDAGHHKDPSTGMGIADAFVAADLLADALERGLTGQEPLDDALLTYARARDRATADSYRMTLSAARLAPTSARLEDLYRRAVGDADLTRQIFGMLGGTVRAEELLPTSGPRSLAAAPASSDQTSRYLRGSACATDAGR